MEGFAFLLDRDSCSPIILGCKSRKNPQKMSLSETRPTIFQPSSIALLHRTSQILYTLLIKCATLRKMFCLFSTLLQKPKAITKVQGSATNFFQLYNVKTLKLQVFLSKAQRNVSAEVELSKFHSFYLKNVFELRPAPILYACFTNTRTMSNFSCISLIVCGSIKKQNYESSLNYKRISCHKESGIQQVHNLLYQRVHKYQEIGFIVDLYGENLYETINVMVAASFIYPFFY